MPPKLLCPLCPNLMHYTSKHCRPCAYALQSGPGSPSWKGGRIVDRGYVLVAAPGHPRIRGSKGWGKYVFEHILVMEEHLGRYLLPGETVHHKNGVKDDNKIENLELWVTLQPAGQRPEDLVAYAWEILDRYALASTI